MGISMNSWKSTLLSACLPPFSTFSTFIIGSAVERNQPRIDLGLPRRIGADQLRGAITSFTLATAFSTPLPPYRALSPSRSSTASLAPVDAPDGTEADTRVPSASVTKTRTVGLPRESRISRAFTPVMLAFMGSLPGESDRPRHRLTVEPDGAELVGSAITTGFQSGHVANSTPRAKTESTGRLLSVIRMWPSSCHRGQGRWRALRPTPPRHSAMA